MTHADFLSLPILALALPVGTCLGVSHAGPGPTWRVITEEACLRLTLAGAAVVAAILAQRSETLRSTSLFAMIPVALLLLELGWATTSPYVPKADD